MKKRNIAIAVIVTAMLSAFTNSPRSANAVSLNSGTLLVVDGLAGTNELGALFAINRVTGKRTLVSDFGNPAQGPLGAFPTGVTVAPGLLGIGGAILVSDSSAGTDENGALFVVDPANGNRKLLSDFGDESQGPHGTVPADVFVETSLLGAGSRIYVVDPGAGANGNGLLFEVDPATGMRSVVSDFGNAAQGSIGQWPSNISIR
ncbi:hypothetical protein [Lysobacter enzymogenes]|uniref:hypothetical protein n=1 Tax=Lysobacter enzymogenes TaxID=69 RepID=UPI00089CCD67|nr:hypothetical protein [Lysobacter enzymogenes]SDX37824.1 hypothetical protein SAMN05421681_10550 [Lysobacter enzymogenes]